MPQWFTPVFKAMWDNPVIGWRGVKIIPQEQRDQLMPHLVEVDPDAAIDYASKSRRGAKWPELEAAILKRGDQSLALKYVHYVVTIPGDDRIRDLVWSKVPEDDNDLWTMGAYVSNLMDWAVRNLYKDHPIPYEQSQKFLPEVAEKAVWESNNPNLLAAYAAKCYQDVPGKLEAALRRIVELGQGTAAIAYVEKAKYARTEILEPLLLDVLVHQGSYLGHDVALYVAHNYDEKVKGPRDAGQILIRELESRGVAVPEAAYKSLGIKPRTASQRIAATLADWQAWAASKAVAQDVIRRIDRDLNSPSSEIMKVYNALAPEAQAEVQKLEDQRFEGHAKPFVDWVRTHVPALALAQESYVQHKPVHPVHPRL